MDPFTKQRVHLAILLLIGLIFSLFLGNSSYTLEGGLMVENPLLYGFGLFYTACYISLHKSIIK